MHCLLRVRPPFRVCAFRESGHHGFWVRVIVPLYLDRVIRLPEAAEAREVALVRVQCLHALPIGVVRLSLCERMWKERCALKWE